MKMDVRVAAGILELMTWWHVTPEPPRLYLRCRCFGVTYHLPWDSTQRTPTATATLLAHGKQCTGEARS
jgi:hypothetical protein